MNEIENATIAAKSRIGAFVAAFFKMFNLKFWAILTTFTTVISGAIILLYVGLGISPSQYLPFQNPFETYGKIYVESPEDYTRERLVNDRYDQDYWLRRQLEQLNNSNKLFAKTNNRSLVMSNDGSNVASALGGNEGGLASDQDGADGKQPFQVVFELRAAMRDRIRQLMLENLLDDRHDLTGNSVYGLKFDTTVIPGANTYATAKVEISLSYNSFTKDKNPKTGEIEEGNIHLSYLSVLSNLRNSKDVSDKEKLANLEKLFDNWLANVQSRINNYIYTTADQCVDGSRSNISQNEYEVQRSIVETALKKVFSINSRDLTQAADSTRKKSRKTISQRLFPPAPWDEYFQIDLTSERNCPQIPRVSLKSFSRSILVVDSQSHLASKNYLKISKLIEDMCAFGTWQARPPQKVKDGAVPVKNFEKGAYCQSPTFDLPQSGDAKLNRLIEDAALLHQKWVAYMATLGDLQKDVAGQGKSDDRRGEISEAAHKFNEDFADNGEFDLRGDQFQKHIMEREFGNNVRNRIYHSDKLANLNKSLRSVFMASIVQDDYDLENNDDKKIGDIVYRDGIPIPSSANNRNNYYQKYKLRSEFTTSDYLNHRDGGNLKVRCIVDTQDGCVMLGDRIYLHSGLAKFVESLSRRDAYAYAAFPKQDVSGVLSSSALSLLASKDKAGTLAARSNTSGALIQPELTGFADGAETGDESINFGWIIESDGQARSIQKSQLVLVSVPAFLEELNLEVKVSWLDNRGESIRTWESGKSGKQKLPVMKVSLPPDFEALDTLATSGAEKRGPAIYDERLKMPIVVRSCSKNDIVIPGSRLWRSATVTLGGQPANKITVLPNMQGIIASFDPYFALPTSYRTPQDGEVESYGIRYDPEREIVVDVDLAIWTSEGVAYFDQSDTSKDADKVKTGESQSDSSTLIKNRAFAIIPIKGSCEEYLATSDTSENDG